MNSEKEWVNIYTVTEDAGRKLSLIAAFCLLTKETEGEDYESAICK